MAKADLKNLEQAVERAWRARIGSAIRRCLSIAGLTQDQAARLIERDAAQVARWIAGTERPQFDAIFGKDELRGPLVQALAELTDGAEVTTTITLRRPACR